MPKVPQQTPNRTIFSFRRASQRQRGERLVKLQPLCVLRRLLRLHPTHLRLPLIYIPIEQA
jgi:hypothetical protein